jgi:hypothetical protein
MREWERLKNVPNKIMLSLSDAIMDKMEKEAEERGCTVQELLRAVIIPEHYKKTVQELVQAFSGYSEPVQKPEQ